MAKRTHSRDGKKILMFLRKSLAAAAAATTLLAGVAAVAIDTATTSPASANTTSATCAQVVLIGARGSNQPAGSGDLGNTWSSGGLGTEVQGVANYVTAHTSKAVRVVGLKYPAAAPSGAAGWAQELGAPAAAALMAGSPSAALTAALHAAQAPGTLYGNSKLAGANALRAELDALATVCPSTETVLVGYSQGAHVIGDVIASSTSPQLSAAAKSHIKAVALEGDPAYRRDEPWDAAVTPMVGNGLFARGVGQFSSFNGSGVRTSGRVMSWCSSGDFFCQSNWGSVTVSSSGVSSTGMDIHTTSYRNSAHYTAIGGWIDSKI